MQATLPRHPLIFRLAVAVAPSSISLSWCPPAAAVDIGYHDMTVPVGNILSNMAILFSTTRFILQGSSRIRIHFLLLNYWLLLTKQKQPLALST